MNHIIFTAENGKIVNFRLSDGLIIAHIDNLTNHTATLATTQAWQQVGQSVGGTSFLGRSLVVRGYVNTDTARKRLLNVMLPGVRGVLSFEGKYAIDCYVQDSPTIQQEKFGQFTFRHFAPYPWWRGINEKLIALGVVTANFSFPVNYGTTHRFGTMDTSGYVNVVNGGTLPCSYVLEIGGSAPVVNPSLVNMYTLKKVAFDIVIPTGYTLRMAREVDNLSIVLIDAAGESEEVFSSLSYDSDMFELDVGDNVLQPTAEEGSGGMQTFIRYSEVYAGVTNDM